MFFRQVLVEEPVTTIKRSKYLICAAGNFYLDFCNSLGDKLLFKDPKSMRTEKTIIANSILTYLTY